MELIYRKRHYTLNGGESSEVQESEVSLSGLDSAIAGVLAVALAGGVFISPYDVNRLSEQLSKDARVDLAASATQRSPVRKRYDFDQLAAQHRDLIAVSDQAEFQFPEVTGEDILATVEAAGGTALVSRNPVTGLIGRIIASYTTEYDPAEMQEVLESLHATGTPPTPSKLVGDLAQTTITGTNGQEQVLCLAEFSISWKRKMVDATTTDDSLYESSLGSAKNWTATSKYMFLDGDQSQIDGVISAIETTALAPLTWNFFPTVATGRTAFTGTAFIDGITIGSGTGKIVGLDCSLKGTGPLILKTQLAPTTNANTVTGLTGAV